MVDDMLELKPFEGATNRTVVVVFLKGRAARYPVGYQYWRKRDGVGSIGFDTPYEEITSAKVTFRAWHAQPVDPRNPVSAWMTGRRKALAAAERILGPSHYRAHAGANSGGANGLYWLEVKGSRPGGLAMVSNITEGAKRDFPSIQAAIEAELLYPLLRGRDVAKWKATPSASILMVQDPQTRRGIAEERMERDFPKAHAYLARHEKILRSRAAFRRYYRDEDPYWSMFNVSPFTFAKWKVVWREQASDFTAAVIDAVDGRPIVPDHKLMLVPLKTKKEANFLCGALNSAPCRFIVSAYAVSISMDTHILENVAVPEFDESKSAHIRLADLCDSAHKAAAKENDAEVREIETEIDKAAAKLWGLSDGELAEINRSLGEM